MDQNIFRNTVATNCLSVGRSRRKKRRRRYVVFSLFVVSMLLFF